MSALSTQIGGDHYKSFPIQPVEFITKNKLGFLEGCVIKRVCRYNNGGKGKEDLEKAIHELQLLLELSFPEEEGELTHCPLCEQPMQTKVKRKEVIDH